MDRGKLLLDQLRKGLSVGYQEEMPGFINFDHGDFTERVDDHTLEIPTDDGVYVVTIKLKETASKSVKVKVIEIDGTITEHDYPEDLKGWQALVDGPIEPIYGFKSPLLIANEEGILMDLPLNQKASELARRRLVGRVILLEGEALKRWDEDV